jgi:hypothetical protein
MRIKVLVCGCEGLKVEPEDLEPRTLQLDAETDVDVECAMVHPQLCGDDGMRDLVRLLRRADEQTWFVCAGCPAEKQARLLGPALKEAAFPQERFLAAAVRGTDTERAYERVLEQIGYALSAESSTALVRDGFCG